MKLEYNFLPSRGILDAVESEKRIKTWAPRLKSQCMLRSSEASRGVMIVGIDPEREKKLTRLYDYMIKEDGGEYLADPEDNGILISKSMAKRLDLLVGDRLVLLVQDRDTEIVGAGMTVRGLFETPVDSFDRFIVFTGIGTLQKLTGLGESVSEINCILFDKEAVDGVKQELIEKIGRAHV